MVFVHLYTTNNNLKFIIYTNSPMKLYTNILLLQLTFILTKVQVLSTSILIDLYNDYVNNAISLYISNIDSMIDSSNNTIYPYDNITNTNSPICCFLNKLEKLSIYHINRFLFAQV